MICSHPDSVLVKTHNALAMDRFGPLITLKLTAGAIYVLRNPLAVAISYSHHLGETVDWTIRLLNSPTAGTPNTPTNVCQQLRSWSEHVRSWTAQAHSPRYPLEDMLSAPEKRFGGVAGFLGLRPPTRAAFELLSLVDLKSCNSARSARLQGTRQVFETLLSRRQGRPMARDPHGSAG
jgi:hypothetical protein